MKTKNGKSQTRKRRVALPGTEREFVSQNTLQRRPVAPVSAGRNGETQSTGNFEVIFAQDLKPGPRPAKELVRDLMRNRDAILKTVIDLQRQLAQLKSKRRKVQEAILALEHLAVEYKSRDAATTRTRLILAATHRSNAATPGNVGFRFGKAG